MPKPPKSRPPGPRIFMTCPWCGRRSAPFPSTPAGWSAHTTAYLGHLIDLHWPELTEVKDARSSTRPDDSTSWLPPVAGE